MTQTKHTFCRICEASCGLVAELGGLSGDHHESVSDEGYVAAVDAVYRHVLETYPSVPVGSVAT